MSAEENRRSAEEAYAAFNRGDAEGAMRNISNSVIWTARGDSSLTGTYEGKQQVAELWARLVEKGLRTEPHDFIADGDKVVVLTTVTIGGERVEAADILNYDSDGKLVVFDQLGDPTVANRVFAA
jgi:ketosteroid isomerase-like protein